MRRLVSAATLLALLALETAEAAPGVFVLKRDPAGIAAEHVPVPPGETVVLPADSASGVIGVVFPPGPGTSSSIEQPRQGRTIVLRGFTDRVHCEVRQDGRPVSSFPDRLHDDLARLETRVSVIGHGARAAFLLTGDSAIADPGPVQNLFAGVPLPLGPGDFVVTADTAPRLVPEPMSGEARLDLDGHAFVRVTGPGGRSGWFIVDTGAAETVVAREFLADTVTITKSERVEYSPAGRRVLDYAPPGATGSVEGVLGHARLSELRCGTIRFMGPVVAVLPAIPDFFGRPVSGILGIDQLRRGGGVVLEYPRGARGAGRLSLGAAPRPAASDERVGFSLISSHPVFPARFNAAGGFLILDSGSPGALLDSVSALRTGVKTLERRTVKGLDGQGASAARAVLESLEVAGRVWRDVPCHVGALAAFRTLRDDRPIGLFGAEGIARYQRVTIDFTTRTLAFSGARTDR